MPTATISGNEYPVYSDVQTADAYLAASLARSAWAALSDDEKAIRLVEATRALDRQRWKSGYQTFAERESIVDIVNASIVIAGSLAGEDADESILTGEASGPIKRLKAASVEIEYHQTAASSAPRGVLPANVLAMIGAYLVNGGMQGVKRSIGGVFAGGTDGISTATQPWGFSKGI
ncbi:hypothetical protein DYI37_03175 [Fulvimarina endophytica]|uniref:Uncharacterized protein n=1 Tax=Fulvimarina endophytica TaxID=2293836 RepID=A0A371XB69_9HYPH|nr:hypothetical protein [Fulvimarina endophytica]RFC66459.1 hypothetical protein DYI37_03175 [Fulvimarina endophytica]